LDGVKVIVLFVLRSCV